MRETEPDVPWQDIIRIGNILRHEYYRIRENIVADILYTGLPQLRPAIVRLIEADGDEPPTSKAS